MNDDFNRDAAYEMHRRFSYIDSAKIIDLDLLVIVNFHF